MKTRTVGGNVIAIEEPKAPAWVFFEVFARERELALVSPKTESKLLPPGAGRLADPR